MSIHWSSLCLPFLGKLRFLLSHPPNPSLLDFRLLSVTRSAHDPFHSIPIHFWSKGHRSCMKDVESSQIINLATVVKIGGKGRSGTYVLSTISECCLVVVVASGPGAGSLQSSVHIGCDAGLALAQIFLLFSAKVCTLALGAGILALLLLQVARAMSEMVNLEFLRLFGSMLKQEER